MRFKVIVFIFFLSLISVLLLFYYQYRGIAAPIKATIVVDVKKTRGPFPNRWKALAQGGEEKGARMLANVIPQLAALYPRYIRLDHIYDFYDVVRRDPAGTLRFNWQKLDDTVCDIYKTGAKPFFSLGYMPAVLSKDGTLVSAPAYWMEWTELVQKTIERYSGKNTRLCGQVSDFWLTDIYYEVWNEPDLETFGKWTHYDSGKDYKTLYFYSSLGAQKATNVHRFLLGGPATTSLYRNWITSLLDFIKQRGLRLDFISWHHYSTQTEGFDRQIRELNSWLSKPNYKNFLYLPKVISEWGYDSNPNPASDSNIGAAHTIAAIRNFFRENLELAFLFEAKDGPVPRWGILSYEGEEKPRYNALKFLNQLQGNEVFVDGEGTFVKALASSSKDKVNLLLVNYDQDERSTESVPVTFANLKPGIYSMKTSYLDGKTFSVANISIPAGVLQRNIIMLPNMVVAIELSKSRD